MWVLRRRAGLGEPQVVLAESLVRTAVGSSELESVIDGVLGNSGKSFLRKTWIWGSISTCEVGLVM